MKRHQQFTWRLSDHHFFAFMPKEMVGVAVAPAGISPTDASEDRALTLVGVVQVGSIWCCSDPKVGVSDSRSPGPLVQRLQLQ